MSQKQYTHNEKTQPNQSDVDRVFQTKNEIVKSVFEFVLKKNSVFLQCHHRAIKRHCENGAKTDYKNGAD